jgi:hypothetical protein
MNEVCYENLVKIDLPLLNCLLRVVLDHNLADYITVKNNMGMSFFMYCYMMLTCTHFDSSNIQGLVIWIYEVNTYWFY